jgi:hypothetical protein
MPTAGSRLCARTLLRLLTVCSRELESPRSLLLLLPPQLLPDGVNELREDNGVFVLVVVEDEGDGEEEIPTQSKARSRACCNCSAGVVGRTADDDAFDLARFDLLLLLFGVD